MQVPKKKSKRQAAAAKPQICIRSVSCLHVVHVDLWLALTPKWVSKLLLDHPKLASKTC